MNAPSQPKTALVIGAGPAGLTAAWVLGRQGVRVHVLEADTIVGGIARTSEYKGFRFDIGGHRFFSKVRAVEALWDQMLGPEMLTRPRLSRIYYDGKWFDYPLKAGNALAGLGLFNAAGIGLSYIWRQAFPIKPEVSFEDWVVNRFGWKLYNTFFKAYTEKVWGIPCTEIGAQWAAQRIKGLSLWSAAREMLLAPFRSKSSTKIRSLIEEFKYPRFGPGMMWETFTTQVQAQGSTVTMASPVVKLHHANGRITAVDYAHEGKTHIGAGRGRGFDDAAQAVDRGDGTGGARRRPRGGREAVATATSSPWPSSSIRRRCSRTTGSTCTIPA